MEPFNKNETPENTNTLTKEGENNTFDFLYVDRGIDKGGETGKQIEATIKNIQTNTKWGNQENIKKFLTTFSEKFKKDIKDNNEILSGEKLQYALDNIQTEITNSKIKEIGYMTNPDIMISNIIGIFKSTPSYQEALLKEQENGLKEQEKLSTTQENGLKEQENGLKEQEKLSTTQEKLSIYTKLQEDYNNKTELIKNLTTTDQLPNISFEKLNTKLSNSQQGIGDILQQILGVDKEAVADYLRYQIYLHNKSEQAKSDPSIVLSIEESASSEQFSSLLRDSGIDSDQFFKNFDTGSNRLARTREQTPETIGKTTLANLSETHSVYNIPGIKESQRDLLYKDISTDLPRAQDKNIIDVLPLPAGIDIRDFAGSINNPAKIADIYKQMVLNSYGADCPLIDNQTNAPRGSDNNKNIRHLMFLHHMVNQNPGINNTSLQNICSRANIQLDNNRNTIDKVRTASNNYLNRILTSQRDHLIDTITQETGPRYVDMVQQLLSDTPGLQNFEIKPQEMMIGLNGMKIPYYLPGHKDKSGEITMDKEGNIRMTNLLYDEGNIDSNTNIMIGHVSIGTAPTMEQYHKNIIHKLSPNILGQSPNQTRQTLDHLYDTATVSVNQDFEFTKASLAHQLAGTQVAEAGLKLMKTFHQTPDTKPSTITDGSIITGPYSDALKGYDYINDTAENRLINASNHPKEYDIMSLFRNSMLSASDTENMRLLQDINTLQYLITSDRNLHEKIKNTDLSLLTTSDDKILLAYCHPERKNLHDLLCLLSNNPDDPSHGSLDHKRMQLLISQLQQLSNGSLNSEAFHLPLQPSQRLSNTIAAAEQNKADKELDNALKGL